MKLYYISAILSVAIISGCGNGIKYEETTQKFSPTSPTKDNTDDIALTFQSIHNDQVIQEVSQTGEGKIIKKQEVQFGEVTIIAKPNDNENLYGVYQTKGILYDLGVVGGQHSPLDDELLSIKELTLFNQSILRINGVFGANASVQNYYVIGNGKVAPFLLVDTGHAVEVDLDGDGMIEIVSTHGTPSSAYIYKWSDGKFAVANVNDVLGATSVYLNDNKQFEAFFETNNTNTLFEYESGVMRTLR